MNPRKKETQTLSHLVEASFSDQSQVKRLRDTLGEPFWTLCDDPQHTSHSLCDFAQVYDRGMAPCYKVGDSIFGSRTF